MLVLFLCIVGFIFLSGVMAAVDAAILSITRPEIDEMIKLDCWGATELGQAESQLNRTLVVIVIFTNLINVLGPLAVGQIAADLYGTQIVAVAAVVLTLGTIVFSEIIPKAVGARHAPVISRFAAPIILILDKAIYPLVSGLAYLSKKLVKGTRRIGTERQIRSLVRIGRRSGLIESDEGQLIHRAFILNDKAAADIMTPIGKVVAINLTDSLNDIAETIRNREYSRYPVLNPETKQVIGVVLAKEVLAEVSQGQAGPLPATLIHRCPSVHPDRRSDELLLMFRQQHTHLAAVQDSDELVGVVTLEDVLEQLVGDIQDEKDVR